MIIVEGIPQAVLDHAVDQLTVAQTQPGTRAVDQVWRLTHAFLPPGDNHFGVTTADRLHRQMDRLQTRTADLIDGQRRYAIGQPGVQRGLTCRVLATTGRQHLTEDHFIHLIRWNTAARQ